VKPLVAGASGQLGRALVALLGERVAWAGGQEALDVRDAARVRDVVRQVRPDVIFNASAYNRVDAAEAEPEAALATNALGPMNLGRAAGEVGALFVHVSTDYVFDGAQSRPYVEDDAPNPLNAYGLSKRAGEMAVTSLETPWLLVRTSGVFGRGGSRGTGGSFVERILERARTGAALRVVDDQTFSPTYAPDLAGGLIALVESGQRGLFHLTNAGQCTWHGLAVAALQATELEAEVQAIRSADLAAPARRPAYSVLSNRRYLSLGLSPLRPWPEALGEFLGG